jgi:hypothetical protein
MQTCSSECCFTSPYCERRCVQIQNDTPAIQYQNLLSLSLSVSENISLKWYLLFNFVRESDCNFSSASHSTTTSQVHIISWWAKQQSDFRRRLRVIRLLHMSRGPKVIIGSNIMCPQIPLPYSLIILLLAELVLAHIRQAPSLVHYLSIQLYVNDLYWSVTFYGGGPRYAIFWRRRREAALPQAMPKDFSVSLILKQSENIRNFM